MNTSFQFSGHGIIGLGSRLMEGHLSVDRDLALTKEAGRWTIVNATSIQLNEIFLKGRDLLELMEIAANNQTLPEKFKEMQDLTQDPKFKQFCRLIPGIENPEHAHRRERTMVAMQRAFELAKTVGKGLSEIKKQGLMGRYVGQGQNDHPYWMRELSGRGWLSNESNILIEGWKIDESNLSLREWESSKRREWSDLEVDKTFLEWIAQQSWENEEKKAWQLAHPEEIFDTEKLERWSDREIDADLFVPIWKLKQWCGPEKDFAIWKEEAIKSRKEIWEEFKRNTGALDLTFEDHEKWDFESFTKGFVENVDRWKLQQFGKKIAPEENFYTFVHKLKWSQEPRELSFSDWLNKQEKDLHARHQGSHLPLHYEEWRRQQYDGKHLAEPSSFILLDSEQRKIYTTQCDNGVLRRNNYLFDTSYEETAHSGTGYAIFVIAPDQKLYCGSHIGGIFHHSSFLGGSAVVGAGEIRTNSEGKIIEVSGKSGHYRPEMEQNVTILRYFQDRGTDLAKVQFSYYEKNESIQTNALEYLKQHGTIN